MNAPRRLPRPPITTTMKAGTRMLTSMSMETPSTGAAATPASAASADPKAKTDEKSSETLMPRPSAVALSSTAARTIAPRRLRSSSRHSSTASTRPKPMMNTR